MREFTVAGAYQASHAGPVRWLLSHLGRYKLLLAGTVGFTLLMNALNAGIPVVTGLAFAEVLDGGDRDDLLRLALITLALIVARTAADYAGRFLVEMLGKRLARDARDELARSLLGKSQTFHNRQRIGDVMARATNDTWSLADMITPGADLILDSFSSLAIALLFIGLLDPQLLAAPLLFTLAFAVALRLYMRRLAPVAGAMRGAFGQVNAGLTESITNIELVKSSAAEPEEAAAFAANAGRYRDLFVQNGEIQARYLALALLAVAMAGAFLHGYWLVSRGQLSPGELVSYLGLMALIGFPASMSVWTFNLVGLGIAAAGRVLALIAAESELDENEAGVVAPLRGEIVFDRVSFSYGYGGKPVLRDISFRAAPGQTVALVGQTGSGKSTLAKLVNRLYDVDEGRILIDGIDVREWNLHSLRGQIATIEQDIFLFSRTIRENITFGVGGAADPAAVEQAAREAQAHAFITAFADGYETVIGERGLTLSGGQRQRLAIARALLGDPRILLLDDATSAVDSATEDEIQKAIRRLLEGRTTLLITHRLAQIRRADHILVLADGTITDQGAHDELLARCPLYRRLFTPARDREVERSEPALSINGAAAGRAPAPNTQPPTPASGAKPWVS